MRKLLCLVSPLALLAAMPAHAEEAAEAPTSLEGVVVTGRFQVETEVGKLDAPIAETPQAISVVTRQEFTQRGAQSLQETLRYTAGVMAEAYGNDGRNDYSRIRNVESPIYLDGLRQTFGYYFPRTEIYGIEQVEVLKGPGGALYGAGALGGLINQTSKRPEFQSAGSATVSYGTYHRFQLGVDLTGPLSDTVAGRLVAVGRSADTQTDHVQDDRVMISPSLTWTPTDATTVTVLATYQKDNGGTVSTFPPYAATLFAAPGKFVPANRFFSEPEWEKYDTETKSLSLIVDHRISEALSFASRTRYVDAKVDYQSMYPDSYSDPTNPFIDPARRMVNRYIWAIYPDIETFSTDNHLQARFEAGGVSHTLLAGVDYSHYREASDAISGLTTPIDIYAPVYGTFTVPAGYENATQRQSLLGVYLQDHIRVGDRLSVILGVRRDRTENRLEGSPDQVDKATTYRAAAMYDLTDTVATYLSYSESFQPTPGTTFAGAAFKPTEGRQWEAGVKWRPTPDSLVTLAAYHITEQNRLTPDPAHPNFSIQTGEAELKGIELEGAFKLAGFEVNAAGALADTEITQSNTPAEVGQPLESAAKKQAALFVARPFRLDDETTLRLGGGVRHQGASWSGAIRTPAYTVGDLYAAVDWRDWTFQLNANNVTDKTYYSTCLQRGDCFLGVRRTVTFAVSRSF